MPICPVRFVVLKTDQIKNDKGETLPNCYHCGDPADAGIVIGNKHFCCSGCKQVYLLLSENNLCGYYKLSGSPGMKVKGKFINNRFEYLEDPDIIRQLVQFNSKDQVNITFHLPQIHCSSCIFLLENLHRIEPGVITSRSNFQSKEIFISYNPALLSLRKVVELLAFIGYEPLISLGEAEITSKDFKKKSSEDKKKIYQIGVAGFCFANIMMLSFPGYLSAGYFHEHGLKVTFEWLSLFLSLPVLFFCALPIFVSSWKALRQQHINIDLPITLAIGVTFARSYYEIYTGTGPGYLDSGSGIVFFMLVGRWFQDKTYKSLAFDRDYRSFLPLSVTLLKDNRELNIPVTKLQKGNRIIIRNGEMIPADAILVKGHANIDYSFVSGESITSEKKQGELIHAGGTQAGSAIELEVMKIPSQSYIAELWNNDIFHSKKNKPESFIHPWSRYFTLVLFTVMLLTVAYWMMTDPDKAWQAATAVLIVACPCSLLLSATFTYGNMLRILGKNKLFLKNANVIETLGSVDTIVFDKTGTITQPQQSIVSHEGNSLSVYERNIIGTVSRQSTHPLSKLISEHLLSKDDKSCVVTGFEEHEGLGITGTIAGNNIMMGSADFMGPGFSGSQLINNATKVHVKIGEEIKGLFSITNKYREGFSEVAGKLKTMNYKIHVLSGDNNSETENLQSMFGSEAKLTFAQTPSEKLEYIRILQLSKQIVLMVGDGINDAGALTQADVGISVNNNNAQFTPSCDAIVDGQSVILLHQFLKFAKSGKVIVRASFLLSIIYNMVGLSFAASGHLSPIIAAILMPASSISIVFFATLASNIAAKRSSLTIRNHNEYC